MALIKLNLAQGVTGTLPTSNYVSPDNSPSFIATRSGNLALSDNSLTTVVFNSEVFDSDSKYDTSTGRFTPTVAGKYFLYFQCVLETGANDNNLEFVEGTIYKNTSSYSKCFYDFRSDTDGRTFTVQGNAIMDMNTTDYAEVRVLLNSVTSGDNKVAGGSHESYFGGYKIIT